MRCTEIAPYESLPENRFPGLYAPHINVPCPVGSLQISYLVLYNDFLLTYFKHVQT